MTIWLELKHVFLFPSQICHLSRKREAGSTLRTPEERSPSGAPKEEFGRMIFQKKSSLGDRTKVLWQLLVEVRRGTATSDAPCILDHPCRSVSL